MKDEQALGAGVPTPESCQQLKWPYKTKFFWCKNEQGVLEVLTEKEIDTRNLYSTNPVEVCYRAPQVQEILPFIQVIRYGLHTPIVLKMDYRFWERDGGMCPTLEYHHYNGGIALLNGNKIHAPIIGGHLAQACAELYLILKAEHLLQDNEPQNPLNIEEIQDLSKQQETTLLSALEELKNKYISHLRADDYDMDAPYLIKMGGSFSKNQMIYEITHNTPEGINLLSEAINFATDLFTGKYKTKNI